MNLVHTIQSYFFKFPFHLVIPSPKPSMRIQYLFQHTYMPYMTCPSHPSFDHPIFGEIHIMKLIIMQLSPFSSYFLILRMKYLPLHSVSNIISPSPSLNMRPCYTLIQNNWQNYSSVYFHLCGFR